MSSVLARVDDNNTYDVLIQGATKSEAMAIREGFSALPVNQEWAYKNQGSITEAVRANSILAELHKEYKETIRDVKPAPAPVEEEEPFDDEDGELTLEDLGFQA